MGIFKLDQTVVEHSRTIYGILNAISDLGGVMGIIQGFLAVFLVPIAKFNFILEAIHKLYYAKTTHLLFSNQNQTDEGEILGRNIEKQHIRLAFKDKFCLFF